MIISHGAAEEGAYVRRITIYRNVGCDEAYTGDVTLATRARFVAPCAEPTALDIQAGSDDNGLD
jgi:hypothetical protein